MEHHFTNTLLTVDRLLTYSAPLFHLFTVFFLSSTFDMNQLGTLERAPLIIIIITIITEFESYLSKTNEDSISKSRNFPDIHMVGDTNLPPTIQHLWIFTTLQSYIFAHLKQIILASYFKVHFPGGLKLLPTDSYENLKITHGMVHCLVWQLAERLFENCSSQLPELFMAI